MSTDRGAPPLSERAYRAIAEAIISGDIAPGSKLSEPDFARRFGISRGPLREAVRQLEERGLVERRPRAGVRVVRLSPEAMLDMFIMREALEGMAARLAAMRCTDTDIAGLRVLLRDETERLQRQEVPSTDWVFHARIAQLSGSPRLAMVLESDLYRLMRNYRHRLRIGAGRGARAVEEHRRIVEAIADRDAELAEMLMRRHIAAARAVLHVSLVANPAGTRIDTEEREEEL